MTPRMFARPLVLPLLMLIGVLCPALAGATDLALVARINGAPTVKRGEKSEALKPGDTLRLGDIVETDEHAKVKVLFADDSILDIGPRSQVSIDEFAVAPQSRKVRLRALAGRFKIAIAKFFGGPTDYEVYTPTAVAGVRGTILWGDTELDAICALDGSIEVRSLTSAKPAAKLAAGECVNQMRAGQTAALSPTAAELAAYLKAVTVE